jgi:hypothetical protein
MTASIHPRFNEIVAVFFWHIKGRG